MASLDASSDAVKPELSSDLEEEEFEDPAQAWIALVEACHIADLNTRKKEVQLMIFHAKNSHWTEALYESELELLHDEVSVEYGGPADAHTLQARTKVTARATVYCPFCGNWYTALDFLSHTC